MVKLLIMSVINELLIQSVRGRLGIQIHGQKMLVKMMNLCLLIGARESVLIWIHLRMIEPAMNPKLTINSIFALDESFVSFHCLQDSKLMGSLL